MRGMLDGTEPTVTEGLYRTHAVRNDPPPVQRHLPILIGGSGRKVTLKLVARYARCLQPGRCRSMTLPEKEAALRRALRGHRTRRARDRANLSASACRSSATPVRRPSASTRTSSGRNGDATPCGRTSRSARPEDVVETADATGGAGLPPSHLRLPVALRRGDDDPPGHRGPAEAGGDRRRRIEDAAGRRANPRPAAHRPGRRPGARRSIAGHRGQYARHPYRGLTPSTSSSPIRPPVRRDR